MTSSETPHTYRRLFWMAVPIIFANSATPLLGLVDTAVLGQVGGPADLGAIALGALLFNFLYWGVGFLRMSTSGFVAQAQGAQDRDEEAVIVLRAVALALSLSLLFLLLQWPLLWLALRLFGGSAAVEQGVQTYFTIRIWAAPASLSMLVWMGVWIGRGETRLLLWMQLLLNGCNIALDVLFAGVFGWGVVGIAWGTLLSAWLTSALSAYLVLSRLSSQGLLRRDIIEAAWFDWARWKQALQTNSDILIRTLFLLASFAVFTDQSARFGDVTLAANHILMQFLTFWAFFLDGYAHVTESVVGQAWGAKRPSLFRNVIYKTSVLAACTASALALCLWVGGSFWVPLFSKTQAVQDVALHYLPFAACYIALSFGAFQLDGIFIGCTQTQALRNASILSASVFLLLWFGFLEGAGNVGLWSAFLVYVVSRAGALLLFFPRMLRRLD